MELFWRGKDSLFVNMVIASCQWALSQHTNSEMEYKCLQSSNHSTLIRSFQLALTLRSIALDHESKYLFLNHLTYLRTFCMNLMHVITNGLNQHKQFSVICLTCLSRSMPSNGLVNSNSVQLQIHLWSMY